MDVTNDSNVKQQKEKKSVEFEVSAVQQAENTPKEGDGTTAKGKAKAHVTPACIRTRQLRGLFQSPSDQIMSPFSRTINGKKNFHHPNQLKKMTPQSLIDEANKENSDNDEK